MKPVTESNLCLRTPAHVAAFVTNAQTSPLQQPPALSSNDYSALVLAVFRAEADEEVAGSFFAAVPGLPGSGARVQARGWWRDVPVPDLLGARRCSPTPFNASDREHRGADDEKRAAIIHSTDPSC